MREYKTLNHCRYLVQYPIIWCPKFRFPVLRGAVQSTLKEILQTISERYQYEIIEQEVMPDHIPLSQAYGCTDGYGQDTEEYFCD